MDPATFCQEIRTEFSAFQLSDDCADLPYLAMGDFARFAQTAIDSGDEELVRRVFRFAERAHVDGDVQISNAVGVAFLEHLNFQDGKVRREWAYTLLGTHLQRAARNLGVLPGHRPA